MGTGRNWDLTRALVLIAGGSAAAIPSCRVNRDDYQFGEPSAGGEDVDGGMSASPSGARSSGGRDGGTSNEGIGDAGGMRGEGAAAGEDPSSGTGGTGADAGARPGGTEGDGARGAGGGAMASGGGQSGGGVMASGGGQSGGASTGGASGSTNLGGQGGARAGGGAGPITPAEEWAQWHMPNPEAGLPYLHQYQDNQNGTVLDAVTGLLWQQAVSSALTWSEAKQHCTPPWQLPTAIELVSLIDYTRFDPAIDPVAFPDTPVEIFWSATASYPSTTYGVVVDFADGFTAADPEGIAHPVRCVRRS
jgi:hypothetical protein